MDNVDKNEVSSAPSAQYIGGFFEIEEPQGGAPFHDDAVGLSTGRACLAVMIEALSPKRVHVPFYTCDALYEPLAGRCEYEYYHLDRELEIRDLPSLDDGEYLVYINYFGMKRGYVDGLKQRFGNRLLIDDTHDFFRKGHPGHWSFTSARKYFGVPDGAYLYTPGNLELDVVPNESISIDHLVNRRKGKQELAFRQYQAYEKSLTSEISGISSFSSRILGAVDYHRVQERRRENLQFLHDALGEVNTLGLTSVEQGGFCYPLLPETPIPKQAFHSRGIFVPTLWGDVVQRADPGFEWERALSENLIPIPIDHRYTPDDLERVIEVLKESNQW